MKFPEMLVLLLAGLLCTAQLQAQPTAEQQIDSLEKLLPSIQGKERAKVYSDLCWLYTMNDPEKAKFYGQQAFQLASRLNDQAGQAQALNDLGIVYYATSSYDSALHHYHQALALREELKDEEGIAALHNKIGIVHQVKGNLKDALTSQLKSLRFYEKGNDSASIAKGYNNIAIIHYNLDNYQQSLEYHLKAKEIREAIGDSINLAGGLVNIANLYQDLRQYDKAIENMEQALPILRQKQALNYLASALNNLSALHIQQGNAQKALPYLRESLSIRTSQADRKGMASTLVNMGRAHTELRQYGQAKQELERSLELATGIGAKPELERAWENMAVVQERTGNFKEALEAYRNYVFYRDSIYNEEMSSQIAEMQTRFETDKKEQAIELLQQDQEITSLQLAQQDLELKQRNFLIIGLVGAILFIFLLGYLLWNRIRMRQQQVLNEQMLQEQKLRLKAVIETEERERSRIAKDLHDGIGQLLSAARMNYGSLEEEVEQRMPEKKQVYHNSTHILDEACTELRSIAHQMMPRVLQESGLKEAVEEMLEKSLGRSGIRYAFDCWNLPSALPEPVKVGLYRVVQELVNNIIKHSRATEVSVQLYAHKEQVVLVVEDNGLGLPEKATAKGMGMDNIQTRLQAINGHFNITNAPAGGTVATVRASVHQQEEAAVVV